MAAVYDARLIPATCVQERPVTQEGPSDPRSTLSAAIAAVASGADLEVVLGAILDAAARGTGAEMGAVFLQDPDRSGLTLGASFGLPDPARFAAAVADPSHPFAQAAAGRLATFDREAATSDGRMFVGAYVPLVVGAGGVEATVGSFGLGWPAPRTLDAAERGLVEDLARLAAVGVDRARLTSTAAERSDWFERMAHTDPLTGLANERTVARILELELARAGRQGSEVSLALFDVDDFRAANASGGHEVGDDILRRVAAVLAESVRLVDTVGRIGGDEFVLVAPGSAGAMVARRVIDAVTALPAVAGLTMSVSAGVARFPADGTDTESLIAAATSALDRAKDEGAGSVAESEAIAEG
jgi:diguanylate cyclase (GGDEF)-like protein